MSMGGSLVALADDGTTLYYNPAGLATIDGYQVTSFYSTEYGLTSYGALAFAGPRFAAGGTYFQSSGIPETNAGGNEMGQFDLTAGSGMVGLGAKVGPVLVGGTATYVVDTLHTETGSGWTGTLGALLDLGSVRLGAVARHLAGEMRYSTHADAFDPAYAVGVAATIRDATITAEYETVQNAGTEPSAYARAGAEAWVTDSFALRAGAWYDVNNGELNPSAGLGLEFGSVTVDYAYSVPQRLPQTHRLSLSLQLPQGGPSPPAQLDVSTETGITLIGRVVDSDGNPLRRVRVEAWQSWEDRYASSSNHWKIPFWRMPTTLTDADGYFRLEDLRDYPQMESRTYYIVFSPPGDGWAHTGFYLPFRGHRAGDVVDWGTISVNREAPNRR